MVATDETALICDFAERYHVLDWRALPVRTAAALAAGLEADTRIMRKLIGAPTDLQTLLLAMIADFVHILAWQHSRDGAEGRNAPKSILKLILEKNADLGAEGFESVDEFLSWHASMTGGVSDG